MHANCPCLFARDRKAPADPATALHNFVTRAGYIELKINTVVDALQVGLVDSTTTLTDL